MKINVIKIAILFFVLIITFVYSIKWLDSINFDFDSNTVEMLIENSTNFNRENIIINTVVSTITSDKYNPVSVILDKYSYLSSDEVSFEDSNVDDVVSDASSSINDYLIYIYNTHQTEKYSSSDSAVSVSPSVLDASFMLKEELKKYDISSLVEEGSIKDILDTNNWNYASSYKVSRMYLENAKKNNPSLKYFIDIHRDSVNKNISTVLIDGKSYARTMFLLGLDNSNNSLNKQILLKMENWLNINYPGLSRGIYEKGGKGVNGVYNQDFSSNCILIEIGGSFNTSEEIYNSISVIALMLNEYIGGRL